MFSFFSRPFPIEISFKRIFRIGLFFALFIFLFLFIFGPFGMADIEVNKRLFAAAGYGILCFIVLLIVFVTEKFLPGIFSEEKWTVGKEIIHSILIFIVIGAANFLFSVWLGFVSLSIRGFFVYQYITLMVGGLPYTILVILKQNSLMKKYLREATALNQSIAAHQLEIANEPKSIATDTPGNGSTMILLESENKNDNLKVDAVSLLVISSADNYIEVFYSERNELRRKLLRSTLKKAENTLKTHSMFLRCHKGFIVNTTKIKSVTGNAQGYKLILENYDAAVPVSRNMNKALEEMIA